MNLPVEELTKRGILYYYNHLILKSTFEILICQGLFVFIRKTYESYFILSWTINETQRKVIKDDKQDTT